MAACTPAGTSTRPLHGADLAGQLGLGGGGHHPGRAGVGDRRRVGAEADDHADVELEGQVDDRRGERPPRVVGLGADEEERRRWPSRSAPARSSMTGQLRPVWMPSTRCIVGRRARWSSSESVSKVATTSLGVPAVMVCERRARPEAGVDPAVEHHDQQRCGQVGALRRARRGRSRQLSLSRAARADSASATTWAPKKSKSPSPPRWPMAPPL